MSKKAVKKVKDKKKSFSKWREIRVELDYKKYVSKEESSKMCLPPSRKRI